MAQASGAVSTSGLATAERIGDEGARRAPPARDRGRRGRFHPKRDLYARRLWRERARHVLRVLSLVLGDIVGVLGSLWLTGSSVEAGLAPERALTLAPLAIVVALGSQALLGTYAANRGRRSYARAFAGGLLTGALVFGLGKIYPFLALPDIAAAGFAVLAAVSFCVDRLLIDFVVREIYALGFGRRPTLLVGEQENIEYIKEQLRLSNERRIRVIGHLSPGPSGKSDEALGTLADLGPVLESHDIESVIISAHLEAEVLESVIRECFSHGVQVSVVPDFVTDLPCQAASQDILGWPLVQFRLPRMHVAQTVMKRALDLAIATAGLVVFAPLGCLVAVAIKLDSSGPVFFRQQRLGTGGRPFTILKFRTMRENAEEVLWSRPELYREYRENDCKFPPGRDPRITRVGRLLRRTSLDELPQLLNVLKGDMSLVGPRPILPDQIRHYGDHAALFLGVRPGITGYWQVNGRSEVAYPERAELDIQYIKNWSLGTDMKILFQTIPKVLEREGAH